MPSISPAMLYFIFSKSDILLHCHPDGTLSIPVADEPPVKTEPWTHIMTVSSLSDDTSVRTFNVDKPQSLVVTDAALLADGYRWVSLRESFYHLPRHHYLVAGKCEELLYWDRNTRFCGCCGGPMRMSTDISKKCTECGKEVWPQLATAVIVRIRRGDEVFLAHGRSFRDNFYGLVAGFVETGETLEEAVHREVREETGMRIHNLRYFGSQPWPYPCGLMVGFTADYLSGEIHLQREELSSGNWFRYDNMPRIPQRLSIARRLLDDWLAECGVTVDQD